jgi:hypothetical protein
LKEYDPSFKDRISISNIDYYGNNDNKELLKHDQEVLADLIRYKVGVRAYAPKKWGERLLESEEYIHLNEKFPTRTSTDPCVRSLGHWINRQQHNHNSGEHNMKIGAAIRGTLSDFTAKYEVYFLYDVPKWKSTLAEVVNYIIANNKLPSQRDADPDIKVLGRWISTQRQQFKNEKYIMKNVMIRNIWINFKNKHEKYFPSNHKKSKLKPQHDEFDESETLSSQ